METKKKKPIKHKVLSLLLLLVLALPISAFASTAGTGTSSNPYQLDSTTLENLKSAHPDYYLASVVFYSSAMSKYYKEYYFSQSEITYKSADASVNSTSTLLRFTDSATSWSSGINVGNSYSRGVGAEQFNSFTAVYAPAPAEDPGTTPDTGDNTNTNPNTGGNTNMFTNITSTSILTEATTWAGNFDSMLLVVVGVGVGFACVRFVKGLFF